MSESKKISLSDTVVAEEKNALIAFLDKYETGKDVFTGYNAVDGKVHILIHDPDTYEVIHRGEFQDSGLGQQYMEQQRSSVSHDVWTGPKPGDVRFGGPVEERGTKGSNSLE
ncbi:hypothetical protein KCU81_g3632, partial [Aureobasidium melanogenum]|uniref:Uncharacterized protein n=1 Tax=Aureobasidium melanogenum (strain CBS 110374) TaxID=1043003 RepID=A0A074VS34_AURM1